MGVYGRKLKKGYRLFYSGQYLGQKYFSKAIYHTKKECKDAERAKINELDQQVRNPVKNLSLVDLANERLDLIKQTKSDKYYLENKAYFKILTDTIGDIEISQVKKQSIIQILLDVSKNLKERKRGNYKLNAMIRCYKALFNYGLSLYDLDFRNPVKGIKFFPLDIKPKYIPTDDEIKAVKEKCDKEERLLIEFCQKTGARISEALRLENKNVGENFIILYTRKAKNQNLTPRKVPRPPCLIEPLKKKVFGRWSEEPRFLEKIVRDLKQPSWNWHNLRHKYASELSYQGRPLFEIMQLLGHSSLKTTQIYLHQLSLANL
ncbi:MAG: tyrosine-type recombinase/integrase [Deltaproteobacteria bacterium]|nr:tyrosine-type recombinase/integrase [Deltaproteobacteria bacterium]